MANIEEDGQSCIQEANDNWGSDVVAVEKCLYTHKWVDGRTVTRPQLLDNDLTHWSLVNDDRNISNYDMGLTPIRENEFL